MAFNYSSNSSFHRSMLQSSSVVALLVLLFQSIPYGSCQHILGISPGLSLQCTAEERTNMERCRAEAAYDWDILDVDTDTPTRKFCCYVWDTLNCQVNSVERCDSHYAQNLVFQTEQRYGAICEYHYRYSASCVLRWWSISLIVIGGVLLIALVAFLVYRRNQTKFSREYKTSNESY